MSKINCPCGWQMSDVGQPSPYVRHYLTDNELEELYELLPKKDPVHAASEVHALSREFWQCDQCGRIAFPRAGAPLRWYRPEFEWKHGDGEALP